MIRNTLVEAEWANPKATVVAVLSVIFDHSAHRLAQEITEHQHDYHHAVLCSQHVHLDKHKCMEVILMQGTAEELRKLSDTIMTTRGVTAGKLTLMSRNF
jgi:CopG family nickel-responsive transcriptional regulator